MDICRVRCFVPLAEDAVVLLLTMTIMQNRLKLGGFVARVMEIGTQATAPALIITSRTFQCAALKQIRLKPNLPNQNHQGSQ
jgi:hypothetical protein